MRLIFPVLLAVAICGCERRPPVQVVIEEGPSVENLVQSILDGGGTYKDVPFASLIETTTGNQVLPVDPNEQVDQEILAGLHASLSNVLKKFQRAGFRGSPGKSNQRSQFSLRRSPSQGAGSCTGVYLRVSPDCVREFAALRISRSVDSPQGVRSRHLSRSEACCRRCISEFELAHLLFHSAKGD